MMYFPSSGRRGFGFNEPITVKGTKQELIKMLKKENELRMSEKWISRMEQEFEQMKMESPLAGYTYDLNKPSPTIKALQTEVVKSFGYTTDDEINEAILRLRSAQATYPDDAEITNAANYLRYNRIKQGNFQIGEKLDTKNIDLYHIDIAKQAAKQPRQQQAQAVEAKDADANNEDDGNADEKVKEEEGVELNNTTLDDVLNAKDKSINLVISLSVT